ncbi:MAG: 4-(cytidine 5'-diphospho)-2-C-methyl-D-erythritol kinase [Paludibacteraceae bacterium]|nr:4-(cytidine 5'-diphospho)-2-C-methyl-D-erythritol kinase [Paludibacteraceae bacterium]
MTVYPNCKINLGLRVIRKREDGYHDLETIFVPIYGLHDELEVVPTANSQEPIAFNQEGIAVDCNPEDNLIIKCYRQMAEKYPQIGPVSIRFKKNIPFGAGLGGGSSDAAHMAIVLNELFQLGLSKAQLAAEVRSLGADCPFFIYNTPCYAEGIGDLLSPVDLDLKGTRIILIKPDEGVSTKEAYSGIRPHPEDAQRIKTAIAQSRKSLLSFDFSLSTIFANDFEATVFPKHPIIADIKKRLLDAGAYYASMSGSGSTVFGFFKNDAEGSTDAKLRALKDEFASMILLDDTFGEWKA